MEIKTFDVNCRAADTLPIDTILEFQGKLKKLSKKNKEKLKASIIKHGFIAPLFVWDNAGDWSLLDGHQRLATLISMRQEGYDIPMLPVVYVEASNEADAKIKLLQITSQYGEFSLDGLEEFLDDVGKGFDFNEIRLTNQELDIDFDSEKTERGQSYNDDAAPEIEAQKGMHRLEACLRLEKRGTAIELFAGRGVLTYWYERIFDNVVTNDMQKFEEVKHVHNKKAEDFIKECIDENTEFDLIDFDDEGCPAKEIQIFFEKIKNREKPFVICITDGNGLNLKSRGKINFHKTYMIREDETVKCEGSDYDNFNEIFREFIDKVSDGWKYEELSLFRKSNGNVIYATYYMHK